MWRQPPSAVQRRRSRPQGNKSLHSSTPWPQTWELHAFLSCLYRKNCGGRMSARSYGFIRTYVAVLLSFLVLSGSLAAQTPTQAPAEGFAPQSDPDRKQALEFIDNGKMEIGRASCRERV